MKKMYAILFDDGFGGRILKNEGLYSTSEDALRRCCEMVDTIKNSLVRDGKEVYIEKKNCKNVKEVYISWNIGSKFYSNLFRVVKLK